MIFQNPVLDFITFALINTVFILVVPIVAIIAMSRGRVGYHH